MKKLGHRVARSTIARALKESGMPPSTGRPSSWRTILRSRAEVIAGVDFFTVEVWTARGLVTHYELFGFHHATRAVHIAGITTTPDAPFMAQIARNLTADVEVWTARGLVTHYELFGFHHATRAVHIAGITTTPDAPFMAQIARNLTADDDGFLRGMRHLVFDRDSKFPAQVCQILKDGGVRIVCTSYQASNMNSLSERWVLPVKFECLDPMILFGERSLRIALHECKEHYHRERPHQGVGNDLIDGKLTDGTGKVIADERLGGLLKHYHHAAA